MDYIIFDFDNEFNTTKKSFQKMKGFNSTVFGLLSSNYFLSRDIHRPCFADHSDSNLSWISQFVLDFF